jgi:hypothetical protein
VVVIATQKLPLKQLDKIVRLCANAGIVLRYFQMTLDGAEGAVRMPKDGKAMVEVVGSMLALTGSLSTARKTDA